MNTEPSPVTNGGELEVLPNSKAAPPGKTSIAPAVLATACNQKGLTKTCRGKTSMPFFVANQPYSKPEKQVLNDRRMKRSLAETET